MQMEVAGQQVGHVWIKTRVLQGCQAWGEFLPPGCTAFHKMVHSKTRRDRIGVRYRSTGTRGKCRPRPPAVNSYRGRSGLRVAEICPCATRALRLPGRTPGQSPPGLGCCSRDLAKLLEN